MIYLCGRLRDCSWKEVAFIKRVAHGVTPRYHKMFAKSIVCSAQGDHISAIKVIPELL
jgi:hypothetical protein